MNRRARSPSRLATATIASPASRMAFQFFRAISAAPRMPQRSFGEFISASLLTGRPNGTRKPRRSLRVGVKGLGEQMIQILHRHGELCVGPSRRVIQRRRFDAPPQSLEAQTQRDLLVRVAEGAQQAPNLLRALPGEADGPERSGDSRLLGGDRFE